ncbi:hypothetical protein ROS1_19190 [Roseibium sp. ROS1]
MKVAVAGALRIRIAQEPGRFGPLTPVLGVPELGMLELGMLGLGTPDLEKLSSARKVAAAAAPCPQ